MGTSVFPSLPGLGWSVEKYPAMSTLVRAAVNGQETRVSLWAAPKWHFKLTYDLLRQGTVNGAAYTELATLAGFFLERAGQFDSFLFDDKYTPDDQVTAQPIGQGNGTATTFQLVRSFGGFVEPVRAPNLGATLNIYLAGVLQNASTYSVGAWGSTTPGLVTFNTAPANGAAITADFSFYFPVRFAKDQAEFSQFMAQLWELKELDLVSVV